MREYSKCKLNDEVVFNAMVRSACNSVECAFGQLKANWQVLTKKMDFKLEKISTIIYASFVLHNFCERHSVYINEEQVKTQLELLKTNENQLKNLADPIFSCIAGEGEVIRKALTDFIKENI